MSLNARRTLATMGTELSAEFVIFEPDDTLIEYVKARNPKPFTPTLPDADASYQERRAIDLGDDRTAGRAARRGGEQLGRHQRGRRPPASTRRSSAPAANGTLDDLAVAARVVKGRKVAPGTRFIVTPSTEAIHRAALAAGYVATLMEAGAIVTPATCGACVGGHMGVLGPDEVCITASTRNFKGRMGDPSARIYMASPATVAASALAGKIAERRRVLPGRRVMMAGRVWKFGDNINTDLMLPGPYLYRSAEEQATRGFHEQPAGLGATRCSRATPSSAGSTTAWGRRGRPRGRCAMCGVGFLLAETINGLFFRNAVNYGLLACECPGVSAAFEEGDTAELDIDTWSARNPRTGRTLKVSPVPGQLLAMMLGGGVYPVLEREGLIAARSV